MNVRPALSPATRLGARRSGVVPTAVALALFGGGIHAAPVEFADDFSAESLRFTVDRRPNDRADRSYEVLDDRVVMTISATQENRQGGAELNVWGRSDSLTARVSLDSAELPVDRDADARVRLAGQFWNDTADGGFDGSTGDVYVQLRLRRFGDGAGEASICVDRDSSAEGGENEGVPLFENGDSCERFPDFVPELGVEYTLSISVDRPAGTMTYSIDDMVRSVSLGQPVFVPFNDTRRVEVTQERMPGEAVGSVYAISTDDYAQDFATERPAIGPYRPFFDLARVGRSMSVVDGRARLEVESAEGENERVAMFVFGESDRIESTLELSSESTLVAGAGEPDGQRLQASLGATLYNDTAEGGFNENEGQVFSSVELQQLADARLRIVYCIFRSNTADFSDAIALLQQGDEECRDSGLDVMLDTAYPSSLELDREAGTLTFSAGDSEFVHTITTPIFAVEEDRQFIRARARAWEGSTAVAYIDDYRTSADAPLVSGTTAQGGSTDNGDSSSGGGGCSISGRGGDGMTWLLGLLAIAGIAYRRRAPVA